MIEQVNLTPGYSLNDYAGVAHLAHAVAELRAEAQVLAPKLEGRTVWMVNSTAQGGGVAEMLPQMVGLLGDLGVRTRWLVIGTDRQPFFALTKRIHNLIHGSGEPGMSEEEKALYELVSKELAAEIRSHIGPDDVLVVHDPQPAGMGAIVKRETDVHCVWRCHIGLDEDLPQTEAAWKFLEPYVCEYDHAVFSAAEYIPKYLSAKVSVIHPAIDPFTHKNRELSTHKLVGILCNAQLMHSYEPVLTPAFATPAERLQPDGSFAPATSPHDIGLLFRPIVTQISRWDRLKGWKPLLEAFVQLKKGAMGKKADTRELHRLQIMRLVLAGPEPAAVADDPEAKEVLDELIAEYCSLEPALQNEIALVSLPMASRKVNHLMVNALQRCSSVVVQNSLREGFGLTATEAMWKRTPVLGSSACGLRQQIRHDIDGYLVEDPSDSREVAAGLETVLSSPAARETYARRAQRRVHSEFLIFTQLRRWLRVLASVVEPGRRSLRPSPLPPPAPPSSPAPPVR